MNEAHGIELFSEHAGTSRLPLVQVGVQRHRLPLRVKSRRNLARSGHWRSNVGYRGKSGRSGRPLGMSLPSQEETFYRLANAVTEVVAQTSGSRTTSSYRGRRGRRGQMVYLGDGERQPQKVTSPRAPANRRGPRSQGGGRAPARNERQAPGKISGRTGNAARPGA